MSDATNAGLFGLIVGGIFVLLGGANAWFHLREICGWVRTRGRRVEWSADWDESYRRLGWRPVCA
ncbi:MAG: hypothetical protein JWM10_2111 [Myxococcaceae bacterium]|nr:hypothetical protein [Myxococcaceae bacterium]